MNKNILGSKESKITKPVVPRQEEIVKILIALIFGTSRKALL